MLKIKCMNCMSRYSSAIPEDIAFPKHNNSNSQIVRLKMYIYIRTEIQLQLNL